LTTEIKLLEVIYSPLTQQLRVMYLVTVVITNLFNTLRTGDADLCF